MVQSLANNQINEQFIGQTMIKQENLKMMCELCHKSQDEGYKAHVKKCSEYLAALGKENCQICDVKLSSSSDMMIHLEYKHYGVPENR